MAGKRLWDPRASTVERVPNDIVVSCEQPGIMETPHWHAQVEVNYVRRGALDYEMHGHAMHIPEGHVALFWGGLPHRVSDTGEDTFFHALHLPLAHFFRVRLRSDLQQQLMRGATLVTTESRADDGPAFDRWSRWLVADDPRLVAHAIDELLLRIERIELEPHSLIEPEGAAVGACEGPIHPSFAAISRICGFIAENFREDIDSAAIAVSADIHPKYAMSIFKKSTGMSLGEYVNLLRLSFAQALLSDADCSVLQAAMDSGFGSISAFNKSFRKVAGMTPSEFKRERKMLSQPRVG